MRRRLRYLGTLWLAAALLVGIGCGGGNEHKSDLTYLVTKDDGGEPSADQVRRAVNEIDTRLEGNGHERRNVSKLGASKVRVVLPEADAPNMGEVRKLLEGGDFWKELKVSLTLVAGHGAKK